MKNRDEIPLLFECCRIVRGYNRSVICDLQRFSYRFIPNELADLLIRFKGLSVESIQAEYDHLYDDIIQENFDLLKTSEIVFYTTHPEWFPDMSLEWHDPSPLTNAIIDVIQIDSMDFGNLWTQLSDLGCEHIQIRIFGVVGLHELETALALIGTQRVTAVEILFPYIPNISEQYLVDVVFRQPRISALLIHSAPETRLVYESETNMGTIYFLEETLSDNSHCGQIFQNLFTVNITNFTESHHHNSCLNRKISIDTEGNIKNCPSMSQSFGNIRDTTLQQALEHPDFKKYWNVTKDQIEVCKDCEFRYICTDCRAYIENPQDMYSKPLKCGYNPYTCEWEEWSTNPLKQKAIDYYGMREVLPEFQLKPDFVPSAQPKK